MNLMTSQGSNRRGPDIAVWFRRDLRRADNPILQRAEQLARETGGRVLPVFVLDPTLQSASGANRRAFLLGSLASLRSNGVPLVVFSGEPAPVLVGLLRRTSIGTVIFADDFAPYGRIRDNNLASALVQEGCVVERVGSPYAVDPGSVRKGDGTAFKVFTPFKRVWLSLAQQSLSSLHSSADTVERMPWLIDDSGLDLSQESRLVPSSANRLPDPSEAGAHARLNEFLQQSLHTYDESRNLPATDGTSRLSPYLKFGQLHPIQILKELDGLKPSAGLETFKSELCWREFYADVLFHRPESARHEWSESMVGFPYDEGPEADARFEAWCYGKTGFPFVDAGMRQLLQEGWMHNRVRMVTASFLVKDLHLDWRRGARWFMRHLVDGDIASNQHGWQWTAGTGTDASPYYRVFNPVGQGQRFDPEGAYIRRYVPELADRTGSGIHEPWLSRTDLFETNSNYPDPIVDHAVERREALRRNDLRKQQRSAT